MRVLVSITLLATGSVCLAECPTADLTGDCYVDMKDLAVMAGWWMSTCLDPNACPDPNACDGADLVPSGQVDGADLLALVDVWLTGNRIPDDMVLIPAGTFQMGDNLGDGDYDSDEQPVHTVTLSSFHMGRYEITNGQYRDFLQSAMEQGLIMVSGGVVYKAGSGTSYPYCDTSTSSSYSQIAYSGGIFSLRTKHGRIMVSDPMVCVTWYGAVAFCNWRSQQEGREPCYDLSTWTCDFSKNGYHLPTEAQWEYAARGGLAGMRFPWGDTISHDQANYWSTGAFSYDISPTRGYHPTWNDGIRPYTSPVGSFAPNGHGLYDMAGNVWEWCNDWYGSYSSDAQTNPTGPEDGIYRVLRGACWVGSADYCRVAYRSYYFWPDSRVDYVGFRVSLDVE